MSKTKSEDERELSFVCELEQPPEQVWRALTEQALLEAWLMPNDFHAKVGESFTFRAADDGAPSVEGTVLSVVPNKLLRYSWRELREDAPDTILTFELTRTPAGGTQLRLIHAKEANLSCIGGLLIAFPSTNRGFTSMRCAA